jgi:hypothetical protein
MGGNQQWFFINGHLKSNGNYCLELDARTFKTFMQICDDSNEMQKWKISNNNKSFIKDDL